MMTFDVPVSYLSVAAGHWVKTLQGDKMHCKNRLCVGNKLIGTTVRLLKGRVTGEESVTLTNNSQYTRNIALGKVDVFSYSLRHTHHFH